MNDARGGARRVSPRTLWWVGALWSTAGAGAMAVGAVLPWARVPLFGVELDVPGVAGLGALTLFAAFLALVFGRRAPLLAVALGLTALAIGAQAQQETGRAVKGHLLGLQQALAPVNNNLARAGLPTVDPFPMGRPWEEFVGPGPLWTFWGGTALAVGAAVMVAGERLGRSCPRCAARWSPARAGTVTFCPACGLRIGPRSACPSCQAPVEPGDIFCAACGVGLNPSETSAAPRS